LLLFPIRLWAGMSNTESESDHPQLHHKLFDLYLTPVEYPSPEVSKGLPSPTPQIPCCPTATPSPQKGKGKPILGGSSSKNPEFSFSTRANMETPVNVKFDCSGKHSGQDNYRIWSASLAIIPKDILAYEVVVDGLSPAENADHTEVDAYINLCYSGSIIIIQVVSYVILEKIVQLGNPHLMWTWLRTKYYSDSAFALVPQIMNIVSRPTQYSVNNLSGVISNMRLQSLHLTKLSKAFFDSYRRRSAACLKKDNAKRDFLLGFLVKHHKNGVDNLTTKDSLSYADVEPTLM